eukprot:1157917-Pelagomonas_calceolata.AAC.3
MAIQVRDGRARAGVPQTHPAILTRGDRDAALGEQRTCMRGHNFGRVAHMQAWSLERRAFGNPTLKVGSAPGKSTTTGAK